MGTGLPLAGRLATYYTVGLILIVPYIAKKIKEKPLKYAFVVFVLFLDFFLAYFASSANDYINMKVESII